MFPDTIPISEQVEGEEQDVQAGQPETGPGVGKVDQYYKTILITSTRGSFVEDLKSD